MIDVSDYQGVVDWVKVRQSGIERAYIKLGEDRHRLQNGRIVDAFIDPYAILNVHHARAVGVQLGLYWFAHPGYNKPGESSAACLAFGYGHMLPNDLPIALDLEVEEGLSLPQLDWWKGKWFEPVDSVIGTKATFYSFRHFLNAFHLYPDRPIWGAHPGGITQAERDRWSWWQYGEGRVPGIAGLVDFDETLHPDAVPVIPPAV